MVILPTIKGENTKLKFEIDLNSKNLDDEDEVFVGMTFKVSGDKLILTGGFTKQKRGVSAAKRAKKDAEQVEQDKLTTKKGGDIYL